MKQIISILLSLVLVLALPGQIITITKKKAGGGGGDIAFTELTQGCGSSTGNISTASVSPTSGRIVIVSAAYARPSGDPSALSPGITGNSLTWVEITSAGFGSRRRLYSWRGSGTPTSGVITFTRTGADNVEVCWTVDEVENVDGTTPNDTPTIVEEAGAGGTSAVVPDIGTPGTGDCAYGVFAITGATVSATLEAGFTVLSNQGGGSDVRTIIAGHDCIATVDDTPSASWTGTENYGGIGYILNKAP